MATVTNGLATSFITFSRPSASGGGATVTDRDGKIKWAGHNLLTNSESFDAWNKTGATVSANSTAAPNATTTADTLTATAGTSNHCVYSANVSAIANVNSTVGVYLKKGTHNYVTLIALGSLTSWVAITVDFSGATPVVSKTGAGAAGTYVSSGVDAPVSGFYRVWFTGSHTTVPVQVEIALASSATPTYGSFGEESWNAAGTETVIAWGAHLYRSDLGGMQQNPAMPAGMGSYYPTTPRNLLGFTEDFSNAAWIKSNIVAFGSGSVANVIVAPNGLQTADKVVASTATNYHAVYQSITLTAAPYVISFYAKAAEYSLVRVNDGAADRYYVSFNLATGAVVAGSTGGVRYVSSAITSVGDGWYRCSVVVSNVSASSAISIVGYPAGATLDAFGASYTGDGTSGIYLWGAQLSDSASLDAYSPVYGAAVTSAAYYAPRLDFDPVTLAARGLLVEEARTNAVTNSSDFTQWSQGGSSAVTANVVVAPDGTTTADDIERVAADSDRRVLTATFTGDGSKTLSVFVKYNTSPSFLLRLYDSSAAAERAFIEFTFTAGVPAAGTPSAGSVEAIENVGGGWYRIKIVASGVVAANTNQFMIYPARAGSANGQKTTFWGAQAEVQTASFSTSLIPTNGATATRAADVASVSTGAFPYSSTEGTIVFNGTLLSTAASGKSAWQLYKDNNERILVLADNGGSALRHLGFVGGSAVAIMDGTTVQNLKDATAYKLNDYAASTNGAAVVPDTSAAVPAAATSLEIGSSTGNPALNGWVKQITYIPRRLTNAELVARSA